MILKPNMIVEEITVRVTQRFRNLQNFWDIFHNLCPHNSKQTAKNSQDRNFKVFGEKLSWDIEFSKKEIENNKLNI